MLFNSVAFLFLFLPVVLVLYYLIPGRGKNIVLLAASLLFYAWGEPVYVVLLILSVLLNYFCGLDIGRKEETERGKRALVFAVAANVLILFFFKYYAFLLDLLNAFLPEEIPYRKLTVPAGLSFYTLSAISYVTDVYRGKTKPQKNVADLGLYIGMFPKLMAGPVMRYQDMAQQLRNRPFSAGRVGQGAARMVVGLAKKAVLADSMAKIFEQVAGMPAGNISILTAWTGCAAFAFQIYFDFSGYSDMAAGIGQMFGFEFRRNFRDPYVAGSVTEFWQRWHISLGEWVREYLYIPLGGSRGTAVRNMCSLLIVWLLIGMWHGGAWNYIVWGLYIGIVLILEKYVWGSVLDTKPRIFRRIYTILFILVGWVFFFSPSIGFALRYLAAMVGGGAGIADGTGVFLLVTHWLLFGLAVLGSSSAGHSVLKRLTRVFGEGKAGAAAGTAVYLFLFFTAVAFLVSGNDNAFWYYRF